MSRSMRLLQISVFVSSILLPLGSTSWAQQPGSFELRPGVVVDTNQQVAYVGQPEGTIDAVDLSQGRVLWSSDEGAWPLRLHDGQLIAQAAPTASGELLIAVLDPSRRGELRFVVPVELPSGVEALVEERLGQRFTAQANNDQDRLVITWSESNQPVRGMHMTEPATDGARESSGAALLDISRQQVTPIATGELPDAPSLRAPNLAPGQRLPNLGETQFRSADGSYVMTSRRIADDRVEAKYQWTLYSYPSGVQVGVADQAMPYSPFLVTGSQLIVESRPGTWRQGDRLVDRPLQLRATHLSNGIETWRHPIRDTTYHGPFPP